MSSGVKKLAKGRERGGRCKEKGTRRTKIKNFE
jgi:hypothetical protein